MGKSITPYSHVVDQVETAFLDFRRALTRADQARFDAGELLITGPMFGSKTMRAPAGTPADALEREVLRAADLTEEALRALGRRVPGTRRPLTIRLESTEVKPAPPIEPAEGESSPSSGLCLRFALPAGAYATSVLREVMGVHA